MSNKPTVDPMRHDASDRRCVNHERAKRQAGVKRDRDRRCPVCVQPDTPPDPA